MILLLNPNNSRSKCQSQWLDPIDWIPTNWIPTYGIPSDWIPTDHIPTDSIPMTESQRLIPMILLLNPNNSITKCQSQWMDSIDWIQTDRIPTYGIHSGWTQSRWLNPKDLYQWFTYWIPMIQSQSVNPNNWIQLTESQPKESIVTESQLTQARWLNPKDWYQWFNYWIPITQSQWLDPID
jgi:hypothetical protein